MKIPSEIKSKLVDLKNYEILMTIGKGSFGSVHLVIEKSTKIKYAAKVLFLEFDFDELSDSDDTDDETNTHNDIFNEFIILSKNNYKALLNLVGFSLKDFIGNQHPTIICPYMPNGTVTSFFDSIHKTNTRVFIILLGISIGMRHLHINRIAHRDLKSDNVLLDENFYPRIADFGISKQEKDDGSLFKTCIGSPIIQAPEVLEGLQYTKEVDIFSFGITSYRLLTNRIPYENNKFQIHQFIRNVVNNKMRPDTSFITNDRIKSFLERCWSENAEERPSFDDIIIEMTQKVFYQNFDININEVIKYLETFGEEFNEIIKKLKDDNPIKDLKDSYEDNLDENSYEDYEEDHEEVLGLTDEELNFVLRSIKVDAATFYTWAKTYDLDSDISDEKRDEVIENLVERTHYSRKVIQIIYDYAIDNPDGGILLQSTLFNS